MSLCPLVNLDLFKKGFYYVSCHLIDQQAEQTYSKITCLEIQDLLGPQLTDFIYPGACIRENCFITQTVLVEYTEQTFSLGECFVFQVNSPIRGDYTEVYVPSNFSLQLKLMFSGNEELPKDPSMFTCASTRVLSFEIDWRKGLHDHTPVLFDYFHSAAIGVTIHASLFEFSLNKFRVHTGNVPQRRASTRSSFSGRKWAFQSQSATAAFPSFSSILFGEEPPQLDDVAQAATIDRQAAYKVPKSEIQRAQDAHQMLCDVLRSARDSLHIGYAIMSGEQSNVDPGPDHGDISLATSLSEAEDICHKQITDLNTSLASTWEWFCRSAVVHPDMISYLAKQFHSLKLLFAAETLIGHDNHHFKTVSNITDPLAQAVVATKARKGLQIPMPFYCMENVESSSTSTILFIEPPPWATLSEGCTGMTNPSVVSLKDLPGVVPGLEGFVKQVQPYLLDSLPHVRAPSRRRRSGVHLVICVHGLQGNQFDLRLYRIFLKLSLPHVRFDFLMSQANQHDTFCDFNLMTDRLLGEILDYVKDMPTPPSKVTFIGHSLGNIVIRSLVTRPEFASLQTKLHLFLSICGPHLGTKYQNGIVSMGMWAVRKWHNSQSLLQLSLKDAPNSRDSFLYHLSEAPSFEYFRHVVLLSSPQDKYVPYHSAKIASTTRDGSLQSNLSLEMMQNILEPLRDARVNLVRVSVDHSIPTSANSMIGRAAHIAMLDNELFIEKFVMLHLSQYFVES